MDEKNLLKIELFVAPYTYRRYDVRIYVMYESKYVVDKFLVVALIFYTT